MRKTILLLFLIVASFSRGQNKMSSDTIVKKTHKEFNCFYFGISANFNDDLNLNQKLRNQNLPQQDSFVTELQLGYNFFGKRVSGNIGMGFLFDLAFQNDNYMVHSGYNLPFNFHYNVVNNKRSAITAGLSSAFTGNVYSIFVKNNSVDLDNIAGSSGQALLSNGMLYVGPSAAIYLFRNSKYKFKFNAGYDFALTKGNYRNYGGGNIVNSIGESGNNRFVIGLFFVK